jgi:chromosome segregation ATPase
MADRAQVTSVEALESFRAKLVVYVNKARAAVDETSSEVYRTRQWLQNDQRRYWDDQLRIRRKKLEQAQSELSSARLSSLQDPTARLQMIVRKARESVHEAEAKLNLLKKWDRELENRAEPLLRQTNQLQHALNNEMPKALAYLAQVVKTLDAYADIASPRSTPNSASAPVDPDATSRIPEPDAKPPEGGES